MYPAITLQITFLQHYPGGKSYKFLELLHTLQYCKSYGWLKHQIQQELWKAKSKSYGWLQASTIII